MTPFSLLFAIKSSIYQNWPTTENFEIERKLGKVIATLHIAFSLRFHSCCAFNQQVQVSASQASVFMFLGYEVT